MGEFIGEVAPIWGRWHWPIKLLQPGDYFRVDHALKPPAEVGHYVNVRSTQLGIPLSFQTNDPDCPGFCRVTRRDYANVPEIDGSVMDYDKVHDKLSSWYGVALNDVLPWGAFAQKQVAFIAAEQIEKPPIKRMIVKTKLHDGWFGLVFKQDGMEFHPLPPGSSLKSWKLEEIVDPLADVMC